MTRIKEPFPELTKIRPLNPSPCPDEQKFTMASMMPNLESQQSLDYDIQPGTIYIVDIYKNHTNLLHAGGNEQSIVLVPQPSSDPRDPLVSLSS